MATETVEYGPKVLQLMSLKLARMAYVAGGKSKKGARDVLDDRKRHDDLAMYACGWALRSIVIIRGVTAYSMKTDEELAQEVMDVIGMDPTSPCQCCGEYH